MGKDREQLPRAASPEELPDAPSEGFRWVLYQGERAKLWADGALRRPNGYFVLRHPAGQPASVAAAAALSQSRRVAHVGDALAVFRERKQTARKIEAQRQAELGLLAAAKELGPVKAPPEAWGFLVRKQAEVGMSGGRESTGAARFVGEATGFLTRLDEQRPGGVQVNVIVGGQLAGRYGRAEDADVVEGEARPLSDDSIDSEDSEDSI